MSHAFLPVVPAAVAVLLATWAAACDLRTRRIPNRLVLLCICVAFVTRFVSYGWRGVAGSAAAAVIALTIMLVGFLLGGIGAGDVKLMGAMGAFAGLSSLPLLMIATFLAGGVFSLVAIYRASHAPSFRVSQSGTVSALRAITIPYAVPIACGVLTVFCNLLWSLAG